MLKTFFACKDILNVTRGRSKELINVAIPMEHKSEWILCPVCHCRTRIKVRKDTVLLNFPLFCPKCKSELLINIVDNKIYVAIE